MEKGRKIMKKYIVLFILCLLSLQCSKNNWISTEEMRKIVDERNNKLGRFFIMGNADSLASMYTGSAVVAPHGDEFYSGSEEILSMYRKDFRDAKILQMRTETMRVEGNKEVIYETGKAYLTINFQDSTYDTHAKFCNIWRLQDDGTYKLDVDIWNRDNN